MVISLLYSAAVVQVMMYVFGQTCLDAGVTFLLSYYSGARACGPQGLDVRFSVDIHHCEFCAARKSDSGRGFGCVDRCCAGYRAWLYMLNGAEADQSDAMCGDAAVVVVSLGCVFGSCAYG